MISSDLPNALERLHEISGNAGSRRPALFLDYDGTLTPIVARPELAVLSEHARETLRELARTTTVAVISGRDLLDVQAMVGIEEIYYAGSHGFEIGGPGGWRRDARNAEEFLPALEAAEQELRLRLAAVPGALIERKRFSLAVHFRLVEQAFLPAIEEAVAEVASRYLNLRRTSGKKVSELQPLLDWNKGKAVLWLLEALDLKLEDVLPVFIGDDLTDEDAFAALHSIGVGIIVRDGPRPTAASYALESSAEVVNFLRLLRQADIW